MRADAETPKVLYFVEPAEHVVLQGLEREVLSVLSTNKLAGHATWVNKLDAANDRFVQLWAATESQSTFLLEWPSSDLATHALDALRLHLQSKQRQRKSTRRRKQQAPLAGMRGFTRTHAK